jgi:sulfoxide reductase heme-binding subunit YedZ
MSARAQRYRRLYQPLLFVACLVPVAGCIGGILDSSGLPRMPGFDLGSDPVRAVLDTLAKTALNLLVATLSITPLRWLTGNAQLLQLRRMLGLFAFSYASLHFLVYMAVFQAFDWHEIGKDIAKRPFITIGLISLLLLLPLALTSTDRMQRRLGRHWQRLHRLIYLVAPLVVLHYWKMLKHEYRGPLGYGLVIAALLLLRLWLWRRRAATWRSGLPRAPETAAGATPSRDN